MGFNAVADQFRKWKRNSQTRESPSTSSHWRQEQQLNHNENKRTLRAAVTAAADSSLPPAAVVHNKKNTNNDKNTNNKLRKPPPPPSPDSYLQGIGDYTFIRQVGQGKFSRVMLSFHCLTKKQVAVKIIDKRVHNYRIMSRLVREISLMEVLDHPNIVRLYETYETTDSLYLVMEYVEGYNLDELLKQRGGKLPESDARDIFRQMASAMDYCHSRWVVHRDLKAPNILLTMDSQVKIADFGLGNRYGRKRLKTICGSMLYYSPEIINGQGYTGPEVDCWCLGVSLYRMTVGEEPFSRANSFGDLRKDVTAGSFTIPSHLSPALKDTIMKCMAIDKNKRTRVHLALKGDPWLMNEGKLANIFIYGTQPTISIATKTGHKDEEMRRRKKEKERMKYQHMRDMEEEKRSKKLIKRTIVCHPKNPSIYYTSVVPHSPKSEDTYANSETQRHLLFQKVNEISRQIQLIPAHKTVTKSPIRHLLRKLKQPDSNGLAQLSPTYLGHSSSENVERETTKPAVTSSKSSGNSSSHASSPSRNIVRKSTSNMSLSQLYQRVAKDQVHYYAFQLTPQAAVRLTNVVESHVPLQHGQQDEFAMMLVIRGICDIMGITYHRDKSDRLICVMALSDYINEKPRSFYKLKRKDSKMVSSSQSLSLHNTNMNETNDGSQGSFSRSSAGLSDMNRSSHFGSSSSRFSKFKRMTSHVFSSIFPYHSSTHVIHDSRSVRYPPFPNINGGSRFNTNHKVPGTANGGSSQSSQNSTLDDDDGAEDKKKSGVAIFAIEIISMSKETQNRAVAIKLSKIEGSSKVFRIACGWITGVIGQNITPAQVSNQFNTLLKYTSSSSTDIPSSINTSHSTMPIPSKRLTRPKSVITLLPVHTTVSHSSTSNQNISTNTTASYTLTSSFKQTPLCLN